jgi:hypothetical protein
MAEQDYKFLGMKADWDRTNRLILEGTSTNPERYVDRGGTIKLSDEEAERLKKSGVKLRKADEPDEDSTPKGGSSEGEGSSGQPGSQSSSGGGAAAATTPTKGSKSDKSGS